MSLLKIENLSVNFLTSEGEVSAVDNVSLKIEENEILALVGETGCGKSVIARSVMRLVPANARIEGRIILTRGRKSFSLLDLDDRDLSKIRAKEMALVPQNPGLALNPLLTIKRQIAELFEIHSDLRKEEFLPSVRGGLKRLGFRGPDILMEMYPHQLSEGMSQRVLIALALALCPALIIADEPTKGLDERAKEQVIQELLSAKFKTLGTADDKSEESGENRKDQSQRIQAFKIPKETSIFMMTHDLDVVRRMADRIIVLYAGEIMESAGCGEFFRKPLHPYSQALLNSSPEQGFRPIPGASPSLIMPPRGCRFHPRCQKSMEVCSSVEPAMFEQRTRMVKCHLCG